MGVSTNGQICFGILFEEDTVFPWNDEKYGQDIDEWWLVEVLKWKPSVEIYNDEGGYIGGVKPSREVIDNYYEERGNFINNSPKLPIKEVNYCSGDYPIYILAVPSTYLCAYRGDPVGFSPSSLDVSFSEIDVLLKFCKDYDIKHEDGPKWYLSSCWG